MSIPNVFKQYQNKKSHPANSTKTHINSKKTKPTNKTKQKKPHNKKPKTQEDSFSLRIRILTQRDCKNQKSPWSCQQAVWDAWDLTVRLPSVMQHLIHPSTTGAFSCSSDSSGNSVLRQGNKNEEDVVVTSSERMRRAFLSTAA